MAFTLRAKPESQQVPGIQSCACDGADCCRRGLLAAMAKVPKMARPTMTLTTALLYQADKRGRFIEPDAALALIDDMG